MIAIAILAAANAPMLLAARDEAQWRRFVRATVQRPADPAARAPSRLIQLQGVVRRLDDDREARSGGPYGL